nr:RDD family protein [Kordia antarctica]
MRFVNFIIDSIAWLFSVFVISFVIGFFVQLNDQRMLTIINFIVIIGTFIAYYAIMEIKFQKTIGKFVTKTKVVKINGEKPENRDIIYRSFYRLIPFDRISFLFTKNGIHDLLSQTKVIKDSVE